MEISGLNHQSQASFLLINVKMPTTVGILTFMSRINFIFCNRTDQFVVDLVEKPKDGFCRDMAHVQITNGKCTSLWLCLC